MKAAALALVLLAAQEAPQKLKFQVEHFNLDVITRAQSLTSASG